MSGKMIGKRQALAIAFASVFAFAAGATAAPTAARARAQQTETPRRPQGPVAGPTIKLPPGAGDEQQAATPKDNGARSPSGTPTRWEYCAITGFGSREKGFHTYVTFAVIRYFPNTTEEVEGESNDDALANAFAKLGDEGWELAGVRTDLHLNEGSGKASATYFFKRPKRQE